MDIQRHLDNEASKNIIVKNSSLTLKAMKFDTETRFPCGYLLTVKIMQQAMIQQKAREGKNILVTLIKMALVKDKKSFTSARGEDV